MKYVLMVVPSNFPNGDAGAVRDMTFALIYQELGYEVVLIGAGRKEKKGDYYNVRYFSSFKDAKQPIEYFLKYISASYRYNVLINQIIEENGIPSIIHINSIPEKTIKKLCGIASKNKLNIIHDSTEWYSPCEFKYGKLDKAYILKDRLNRKVIRNPIRVIGISSYLTKHFQRRGLKAVCIPVIMDVKNSGISENTEDIIKLIYAGSPARKDYLKEIIQGAMLLSENDQKKLELHIFGANEEQIKNITGINILPTFIKIYGRVSRVMVQEKMMTMDFSVLLRPSDERYAKAGFPTKSVEAMSHGVAMICNISSDLGEYLRDGENAIIVDGYNATAFSKSLKRVVSMNREDVDKLKENARELAERRFDYRMWIQKVNSIIE